MTDTSFQAIDDTWSIVQNAFADAYGNASDAQKARVLGVRDMARDAWYAALNKQFHDGDPLVAQLTADLDAENQRMQDDLDALKDAVKFLSFLESAVKTATALAALAA